MSFSQQNPARLYSRPEAVVLLLIAALFAFWLLRRTIDYDRHICAYSGIQGVLSSDAGGYYAYLPAFFIYDFHEPPAYVEYDRAGFGYINGQLASKYPVGTAIAQSPFFLVAHAVAENKNGYSPPYHVAVRIAGIVYAFFGLVCCFFIFRRRTNSWLSLVLCLFMFFATHLDYYTLREPGYSHVVSFFAIALLLLLIDPQRKRTAARWWLVLPLIALIVLIRPVNGLVLLPLLFWNGPLRAQGRRVVEAVRENKTAVLFSLSISAALLSVQLLYNLHASGSFAGRLYPGESFTNCFTPRFDVVLFGTSSGLLLYTPVFVLLLGAIVYAAIRDFKSYGVYAIATLLSLYVYAAWSAPELGCSFSHRAQVDVLVIWFLPFVSLVQRLREQKKWGVGIPVVLFCVACLVYTHTMGTNWWYCAYGSGEFDYTWFRSEVGTAFSKQF